MERGLIKALTCPEGRGGTWTPCVSWGWRGLKKKKRSTPLRIMSGTALMSVQESLRAGASRVKLLHLNQSCRCPKLGNCIEPTQACIQWGSDRSYVPPPQLHKGPLFQAANTAFISKFSRVSPQFPWRVFIGPHFKSNDPTPKI